MSNPATVTSSGIAQTNRGRSPSIWIIISYLGPQRKPRLPGRAGDHMAKKKAPTHRPFESRTERGKFIKVCEDMMDSLAWQELNRSQRYLYIEFKRKYTARTVNGVVAEDNSRNISIPASEARKLYGNLETFRGDIDALIERGFIDLVHSGWNTRTANIYGFSERWKGYGQPGYAVPKSSRRPKSESAPV